MALLNLGDGGVGEVVIVAVADHDYVDDGDVSDVAGGFGVALGAHEGEG